MPNGLILLISRIVANTAAAVTLTISGNVAFAGAPLPGVELLAPKEDSQRAVAVTLVNLSANQRAAHRALDEVGRAHARRLGETSRAAHPQ